MAKENDLLDLTSDIVAAHVANNTVAVGDVPSLILKIHAALRSVSDQPDLSTEPKKGMVSVKASIKPDFVVCMECGSRQTMLKRHIQVAHGLTPDEYREDYGLPKEYPMVAPNYAEKRSELAKASGLGRKRGRSRGGSTKRA